MLLAPWDKLSPLLSMEMCFSTRRPGRQGRWRVPISWQVLGRTASWNFALPHPRFNGFIPLNGTVVLCATTLLQKPRERWRPRGSPLPEPRVQTARPGRSHGATTGQQVIRQAIQQRAFFLARFPQSTRPESTT
jgi:hypothetical protein